MLDKGQRRQILGMAGHQQVRVEESPTILNTDLDTSHISSTAPSPQERPQSGVEIKGNVIVG
jgi:hypothetical protein